jgi:hypothetical protein
MSTLIGLALSSDVGFVRHLLFFRLEIGKLSAEEENAGGLEVEGNPARMRLPKTKENMSR